MGVIEKVKEVIYNTSFYAKYDRFLTNRLRKRMSDSGHQSICDFDAKPLITSDTLFILGSGSSVMNLTDENWEEINTHDSLGFNAWSLHDFVPTFYAIETSKNKFIAELRKEHLNDRLDEYKDTPIFVQYQHMLMAGVNYNNINLPKKNVYYNAPYMPNTTNLRVLNDLIGRLIAKKEKGFCELMHYSSSLSYMIGLGYLMGYKKIVLLGIDLDNSGYFFEHETANDRSQAFSRIYQNEIRAKNKLSKEGSHSTVSKKVTAQYGCLPIDIFVGEVKDALNGVGVELYIGNGKSRLHPMLPLFEFKD